MYEIVYHPLVPKDLQAHKKDAKRILRTIHKKLMRSPETFGKALTGSLKGLYRLRVGDYRVVYRIEKERIIVYVIHIGLRKDFLVYMETARRLRLL